MYEKIIVNKKFLWFILLFFCLIISIPLYTTNLLIGHDTLFHVTRMESIFHGIEAGNFPIKLYGYIFNDYGNPVGYFYPDLFLYIPVFFRLMGFDVTFSYHLFLFVITLFTAILSWFSFTALFKHINENSETPFYLYGFVASILYTGSLYRFSDLYVRAAVGETLAMMFFPMALVFFYLMLKGEKSAWIFVVISSTGILESHILSSLLLFIAYVCMSLIFLKSFFNRNVLKSVLKATVFVVLLNLWFYLPFVDMYSSFDFYMKNSLTSASVLDTLSLDEMLKNHFLIGFLPITIIFFYTIYVVKKIIKKNIERIDIIFIICILLSVIFLILMSSITPWNSFDKIPFLGEKLGALQFTLRLSMFTSFFISIALAIALCVNKKFLIMALVIPFIILSWMTTIPHVEENIMVSIYTGENPTVGDRFFMSEGKKAGKILISTLDTPHNPNFGLYKDYVYNDILESDYKLYTDITSGEYWIAIQNKTLAKLDPYEITPKNIASDFSRKGLCLSFTINAKEETDVKLPLWYYPHSWQASCDGEEIPVFESFKHRVTVTAPAGEHSITVESKLHTPYRNAYIISFIGFLLFLYFCFSVKKVGR